MEIKIYDITRTDTLRHRDTAKIVIEKITIIPKKEDITLDFSGISFASRSFCHELNRGLKDVDVVFVNMLPEVEEMMRLITSKPIIIFKDTITIKKLKLITA